jgi:hypothetical protein
VSGAHDYHDGLPGFHPDQLLHTGCAECEERSARPWVALSYMDNEAFARAWRRASGWQSGAGSGDHISVAEIPLLETLWALQVILERFGVPIGAIPEWGIAYQDREEHER